MPQYIQNPSLMGMQEANEQQKQRSNIYAQAIATATDNMYKQSLADQAMERQILRERELLENRISPSGMPIQDKNFVPPTKYGQQIMDAIMRSRAAQMGVNPEVAPGVPGRQVGVNLMPLPGAQPLQRPSVGGWPINDVNGDTYNQLEWLRELLPPYMFQP